MAKDSRNLSSRTDIESVRKSPQNTFGDNTENGAFHCVDEIVTNSRDEAKEGEATLFSVIAREDDSFVISDNGRGLPMHWNEAEEKWNWELALCTLNASGKFDASQYGGSAGLNGLGLTATNFASEYMIVDSQYDKKHYHIEFKAGEVSKELTIADIEDDESFTRVEFKPDVLVFPALRIKKIPLEPLYNMCRSYAMDIPGLEIDVTTYELDEPVIFKFDNGSVDYIDELPIRGKMLKETKHYEEKFTGTDDEVLYPETYELVAGFSFNFSRGTGITEVYHNGLTMFEAKNNYTLDAVKNGIVNAFMYYGQKTGKVTKKTNMTYKDIENLIICIGYTSCPGYRTWFKHQTKGAIHNPFIVKSLSQLVFNSIMDWANSDLVNADKILKMIMDNIKAREESEKIRKSAINKLTKSISITDMPKKLCDCTSRDTSENEIYIVEGDSAAGASKLARLALIQAIMGLRGKILNCEKATMEAIMNSEIIMDLFRTFGCGIEKGKSKIDLPAFDITKLRYGKIIICTDADVDGSHIRTLVITAIYRLAPELLKQGKVFIAETPLYTMNFKDKGSEQIAFAYSEDEKEYVLSEIEKLGVRREKIKLQRSKGLGENDVEMMHMSTMNPKTRRLIPIEYDDADEESGVLMNKLMGDDITGRKEIIKKYFKDTDIAV